jgi:hypothetical protein
MEAMDRGAHHRAHRGRDNRAPTVDASDDDTIVPIIAPLASAGFDSPGGVVDHVGDGFDSR